MIVVRKFLASIGWFIVLYLIVSLIGGGIVGGIAGANDPENAVEAGRIAGEEFGMTYGVYMLGGSFALAVIGSIFGILPFSRHHKKGASTTEE